MSGDHLGRFGGGGWSSGSGGGGGGEGYPLVNEYSALLTHSTDHHRGFQGMNESLSATAPFFGFSDYYLQQQQQEQGSADRYGQLIIDDASANSTNDVLGASASGTAGKLSSGTTPVGTPNSSVSSSSTEAAGDQAAVAAKEEEVDGSADKSKKLNKPRKKGEKRQREPRFAFMTKSEVDHLEDGYRWRKYGQKAVKNSPYPRSYYRCTTQKCTVKKRVERSFQDPSIVITTYEGQHTHLSPATVRGSSHILAPAQPGGAMQQQYSGFQYQQELQQLMQQQLIPHHVLNHINNNHHLQQQQQQGIRSATMNPNMYLPSPLHQQLQQQQQQQQQLQFPDYGLLQDIVPSYNTNDQP